MLARLPMARIRVPATMTTEFEIGGPPVPSISTAPIMALCRDSSGGLHPAKNNAASAESQILNERANTHPSCQNLIGVCRREWKKNWSAAHWRARTPRYERFTWLLGTGKR